MKFILSIFLLLSFSEANEVKQNINIGAIVAKIDKIAAALKEKETELQARKVSGFEDQDLDKLRKNEIKTWANEADYKRNKLEYLRSKKEYKDTVTEINNTDRYQLLKRVNKLSRVANGYLDSYKKKDSYVIPIDSYFEFSGKTYAYINESIITEVSTSMGEVSASISELEGTIELETCVRTPPYAQSLETIRERKETAGSDPYSPLLLCSAACTSFRLFLANS